MLTRGLIYYSNVIMSAYRRFSIGSWSKRTYSVKENLQKNKQNMVNMLTEFDKYTNYRYDCHIDHYKVSYLISKGEYKEIIKPDYRRVVSQKSIIKRIYIYICAIFPFFAKIFPPKYTKFR